MLIILTKRYFQHLKGKNEITKIQENLKNTLKIKARQVQVNKTKSKKVDSTTHIPSVKKIEKREKVVTEYMFVNGEKPTGLPNAFVVSDNEAIGK